MKKEKQLFERINELMGEFEYSYCGYYFAHHDNNKNINYSCNDDIFWGDLNNDALLTLFSDILKNDEWQKIMFSKFIPEIILDKLIDMKNDIMHLILIYGNPTEYIIERYEKYLTYLDWRYISAYPKTPEFLDKHSDKIIFTHLAVANAYNLPEWFIEKHIDKLDWQEICEFQSLSTEFILKFCEFIPDNCWKLILTKQNLDYNKLEETYKKLLSMKQ